MATYDELVKIGIDARDATRGADEYSKATEKIASSGKKAAEETKGLEKQLALLEKAADRAKEVLAVLFGGAIATLGAREGVKALMEYQDAMQELRLNTTLTRSEVDKLGDSLIKLSSRSSTGVTALAGLAGAVLRAGAKGPEQAAELAQVFAQGKGLAGVGTEQDVRDIGRMFKVTGEDITKAKTYLATIDALNTSLGTTGAEVNSTATSIAGIGATFGISSTQSAALAAAFSSVGTEGGAASLVIGHLLTTMHQATTEGGPLLNIISKLAGVSSDEFKTALQDDAVGALVSFLEGLGRLKADGEDVNAVLEKLGLSNIRLARNLFPVISNTQLLRQALNTAGQEEKNLDEYNKHAAETADNLGSAVKKLTNTVGDSTLAWREWTGTAAQAVLWVNNVARALFGLDDEAHRVTGSAQVAANIIKSTLVGALVALVTYFALTTAAAFTLAGAIAAVTTALTALKVALVSNPIGVIAVAIGAVVGLWYEYSTSVETAKNKTTEFATKASADLDRLQESARKVSIELKRALEVGDKNDAQAALRSRLALLKDYSVRLRSSSTAAGFIQDLDPLLGDSQQYQTARANLDKYITDLQRKASAEIQFRRGVAQGRLNAFDNPNTGLGGVDDDMLSKIGATSVKDLPVKGALDIVEAEIKRIQKLVGDKGPTVDELLFDGTTWQKKLEELKDGIALVEKFGGDQEALSAAQARAKASQEATTEALKMYHGRLLPAMQAVAEYMGYYDELTRAQKRSREESKAASGQEGFDKQIAKMHEETAAIEQFKGTSEEMNAARERAAALAEFQAKAEEVYSGRLLPAMLAVKKYAEAYDSLTAARKRAADLAKSEAATKELDKLNLELTTEIDLVNRFAGDQSRLSDERERARATVQAQTLAEQAYGKGTTVASDAVAKYLSNLVALQNARRSAEGRAELVKANEDLARQIELLGMDSIERAHNAEIVKAQADAEKAYGKNTELAKKAVADYVAGIRQLDDLQKLRQLADDMGNSFGSAFESAVTGAKTLQKAVQDLANDIEKMVIRQTVTQPFASFLSNAIYSAGKGLFGPQLPGYGQPGGPAGPPNPSAYGNAFSGGHVMAFAGGGVVGSSTYFGLAGGRVGLMGEAGPEAILPLSRDSSGKLGVRAQGGGNTTVVNVNVNATDAASFGRSRAQIARSMAEAVKRS